MTAAPEIENSDFSRTLHRMRTNRHAQIKISTPQKRITSTRQHAHRPNSGKTGTALSPTDHGQRVCQTGFEAGQPPKSP
jgi:hypothetical protein